MEVNICIRIGVRAGKWGLRCERSCACAYCDRERGTCVRLLLES